MAEMFKTTREKDGYDGIRGGVKWWIESWGSGDKKSWNLRSKVGHPPRPQDLRNADYITLGLQFPDGHVEYRTKAGSLDV